MLVNPKASGAALQLADVHAKVKHDLGILLSLSAGGGLHFLQVPKPHELWCKAGWRPERGASEVMPRGTT